MLSVGQLGGPADLGSPYTSLWSPGLVVGLLITDDLTLVLGWPWDCMSTIIQEPARSYSCGASRAKPSRAGRPQEALTGIGAVHPAPSASLGSRVMLLVGGVERTPGREWFRNVPLAL